MWRRLAISALLLSVAVAVLIGVGELAGVHVLERVGVLAAEVRPVLKVGLIHSLSGPLEPYERPLRDAEVFALTEINRKGGIEGRLVEWVEADGGSDPRKFATLARRLIETDRVQVVIGGWTAECRRAMRPVVEELDSLLIFPGDYEGTDRSPHVINLGVTVNQNVIPATRWLLDTRGAKKPFLVGNDEIWSRVAMAIARDQFKVSGVEAAGEAVVPFGGDDMNGVVEAIRSSQPDIIFNVLMGASNAALFPALRRAAGSDNSIPVLSFRLGEDEARRLAADGSDGFYITSDYFHTLDSPGNRDFAARFKTTEGDNRPPTAAAVMAYEAVLLWAEAVEKSGDPAPRRTRNAIVRASVDGPEGIITVDSESLAAWRPSHVGRIRTDGTIDVVLSIQRSIRPLVYTQSRTNTEWNAFVEDLRVGWRGAWSGDARSKAPSPRPPG